MSDQTVVRSSCWSCGNVDLPVATVTVFVGADPEQPSYGYRCPHCLGQIRKSTTREAMVLLIAAGSRVVELRSRPSTEPHGGPALTLDDLRALTRALGDRDDLVAALEG